MLDLSQFSQENLSRIQKVLKIVLDTVELQELNRLVGNKVPLRSFEKEDIFYNEIISILNKINDKRENPVLEVLNESLKYEELKDWDDLKPTKELERLENEKMGLEFLGFSKKDLKENIILRIENLDELREIKKETDKKIKGKDLPPLAVFTEHKFLPLPTDPEVIDEYLWVVNKIEKERQRTPDNEPISCPIPKRTLIAQGVPMPEQENSILKILQQNDLIRITQKTVPYYHPLGLDPYENSETIRAVKIVNVISFIQYRNALLNAQKANIGSLDEEVLKTQQLLGRLENDINERAQVVEKLTEYKNGVLKFRSKEIDFRNKPNQKELLATIFEKPEKNWSYDEIQDKWDEMIKLNAIDRPKNYWKKFYSAGDDINKAIAIKTQTEDFIIKNTKEIRINPKYI